MIGAITSMLDNFLGRGSAAVTVPPMDGALKPNNSLEGLPPGIAAKAPGNLVQIDGAPAWSDGADVVSSSGTVVLTVGAPITALAVRNDGVIAVAALNGVLSIFDKDRNDITPAWTRRPDHVTAMSFGSKGEILFCVGSETNDPENWPKDLMEKNASGWVGAASVETGDIFVLATDMAYPSGIVQLPDDTVLVSEAWVSHLIVLGPGAKRTIVLDEIPGYPGHLSKSSGGGYWLSVFAPRNPLIEFVLREPGYRSAMMREVPQEFWVAPAYASGESFLEPLQGGALKQMGILKPWAPSRSYGLVVQLDGDFIPMRSFHSRTGGRRHGVTSALDIGGTLWLTSRGASEVLTFLPDEKGESR
ncbi:strictosidine synthase [Rhodospirillaceae bacterium KN72]|uniref:Strictosidine synthase n=1 Tax=Pacificispira spongiicola TaxID=2729598 RepID=A0A7Y0E3Q2_9PROT|nr:strictosidine synthase [Pacificispira spongiicola]NMM46654.1 strictosidine synthase [Pacificispira spongiicola]